MIKLPIDTFFAAIKKETWHNIDKLSIQLAIPQPKLEELSRFLTNTGITQYNEKKHAIKINHTWNLLLPIGRTAKTLQQ